MFTIVALYHFTRFKNHLELRDPLQKKCEDLGISGSLCFLILRGSPNSFFISSSCLSFAPSSLATRLIRFLPGSFNTEVFVHDYWEEVYMINGSITLGNDEPGNRKITTNSPAYACRPPGTNHGPFRSDEGCMFLEIQYYNNS